MDAARDLKFEMCRSREVSKSSVRAHGGDAAVLQNTEASSQDGRCYECQRARKGDFSGSVLRENISGGASLSNFIVGYALERVLIRVKHGLTRRVWSAGWGWLQRLSLTYLAVSMRKRISGSSGK